MKAFKSVLYSAHGVFAVAFLYALSAGLLIQWVLLPIVMPGLHAGHGLLKGADWVWFNQEAALSAERILHEGWAIWELRPQGNAPIGIAAAVYALTGISEPWVLMPINAGLFAVGAVCLYTMFTAFASRPLAFIATMPFVLFPSAAMIYGQIHKDVWSIAGILLISVVWVRFAMHSISNWRGLFSQAMFTLVGALLIWLVRPYLLKVVLATSMLAAFILVVLAVLARGGNYRGYTVQRWIGVALCLSLLVIFANSRSVPSAPSTASTATTAATPSAPSVPSGQDLYLLDLADPSSTAFKELGQRDMAWHKSKWIPVFAEKLFIEVVQSRRGFAYGYPNAGSNIDIKVEFHSAGDVIRYFPRAFQIGTFSPFPDMWMAPGVSPGADRMRLLSGVETALAYLLLPGVVLLFVRCRDRNTQCAVALMLTVITVIAIIIIALVVSNVGTLYRMRYGYWHVLLGLGMIGWGLWLQRWRANHRRMCQ